jgi:hypothetical protein
VRGDPETRHAEHVFSPALELPVFQKRTRVVRSRRNRYRRLAGAKKYRRKWLVVCGSTSIISVTDAKLPRRIDPPTLDFAVVEKDAWMVRCGSDPDRRVASIQDYGHQVVAHFIRLVSTGLSIALTELPKLVRTPTLDDARGEQRACVIRAGGNANRYCVSTDVHIRQRVAHVIWQRAATTPVAEAKLSELIGTPAFNLASRR